MKNDKHGALRIVYEPLANLVPYSSNARTHSPHQIRQIATSIETFGFTNPVLIDCNNTIIAGHGRVAAAKLLGLIQVPTIRLEHLTDHQRRAYVIADNRLAEKAGWDKSILEIELQHLLTVDGDIDVTVTGFEISEIDLIIEKARVKRTDQDDSFEAAPTSERVSQFGDIWQLGNHRVLCGNALDDAAFKALLGSRQADLVFTDPPHSKAMDGNVSGKGAVQHPDFVMTSGALNDSEFVAFLDSNLRLLSRYSTDNSVHFVCMDWRHIGELLTAGRQNYDALLNLCVWVKDSGRRESLYRSRHELIFVFRNRKGPLPNDSRLGQYGRNRTDVWEFPSAKTRSLQTDEGNLLALPPTIKPVALVADAILDCSARGEVVLDAFLGSGTTLIAAERAGRICYGIEIDPLYVDVAIRRWQKHTGDRAIHAATAKSFDDIAGTSEVEHGR